MPYVAVDPPISPRAYALRSMPHPLLRLPQIDDRPFFVQLHHNLRPFRNGFGLHVQPLKWEHFLSFWSGELDLILRPTGIDQFAETGYPFDARGRC